jgi:hypothetical protein
MDVHASALRADELPSGTELDFPLMVAFETVKFPYRRVIHLILLLVLLGDGDVNNVRGACPSPAGTRLVVVPDVLFGAEFDRP